MDTITQDISTASAPDAADERRLRQVLFANATTSVLGGTAALVAGPALDDVVLGTGHPGWVRVVGALLVVFGIDVALIARSSRATLRRMALVVCGADAVWVVATVATIAVGWYSMSGAVLLGVLAVLVADFCLAQAYLARRIEA